jgi:uncharacterized protein involved in type VI secretion and phage assembly
MFQKSKEDLPQKGGPSKSNLSKAVNKNTADLSQGIDQKKQAKDADQMFMNQNQVPNQPTTVDKKLWAKQPTSKIHNAAAIPSSEVAGINRVIKLQIVIDGTVIQYFKHFKLVQSANRHHEFSLTLAYDVLGSAENHNMKQVQNFLGKRITVIFSYKDVENSPERNFVGVITEVGFAQDTGSLGNIVLTGFSPTVLLDAAPHTQSFGGKEPVSLNTIASEVLKEGLGENKFDFRVDAKHNNVNYSSQYEETHYNYLARIAEAYGEQFFYDGEVMHFGKLPPPEKTLTLVYGSSVNDIRVKMRALHVNPIFYGYNSSRNEKLQMGSSKIDHKSEVAKQAYEISKKTYTTPSLRVAPIRAVNFMDVEESQKGTAGSNASEVFITSGTTSVPFLYPGCCADLEMRKPDSNETMYFTKIMMLNVVHEVDGRGYYEGSFDAIAADSGFIPRPEFQMPKADAQLGTVISNTDPLNQGRVQVQFDWQNHNTTHFIRMMSPDAGGTDQVTQNRGYIAIPEVGDQVMVGFVHNHPDRPFVMGGIFHGETALGGGINNHMRSIQTKSGIKVLMNDDEKSVTILDPSGNTWFMDGQGSITVTAPKNFTVNAGENITMKAGKEVSVDAGTNITNSANEDITSVAGKDIAQTASGDIREMSDNRTELIEKDFKRQSEISNEIAGEIAMFSEKENMTMQSGKIVEFNSAEKSKLF